MNSIIGQVLPLLYFLPGVLTVIVVVVAFVHYFTFGPKTFEDEENETILWWSIWERLIHWVLMITFVIMALTGLILSISEQKSGEGFIGNIRVLHHIGPVFGVAVALMAIIWIRFAIFKKYDFTWFRHIGGYLGYKGKLKAGKFNAGQKVWFWIALIFGILLGVTGGQIAELPIGPTRNMFIAIHLISATFMLGMFMVHLYMSLFLVKGSLKGIISGKIDKKKAQVMHPEAKVFRSNQA